MSLSDYVSVTTWGHEDNVLRVHILNVVHGMVEQEVRRAAAREAIRAGIDEWKHGCWAAERASLVVTPSLFKFDLQDVNNVLAEVYTYQLVKALDPPLTAAGLIRSSQGLMTWRWPYVDPLLFEMRIAAEEAGSAP